MLRVKKGGGINIEAQSSIDKVTGWNATTKHSYYNVQIAMTLTRGKLTFSQQMCFVHARKKCHACILHYLFTHPLATYQPIKINM